MGGEPIAAFVPRQRLMVPHRAVDTQAYSAQVVLIKCQGGERFPVWGVKGLGSVHLQDISRVRYGRMVA